MPQLSDTCRPAPRDHESSAGRPAAQVRLGHVRTVVLGYDGSRAARRALVRAAEAAGKGGRVLVVIAVPPVEPFAQERSSRVDEPRRLIEQASAVLREHGVEVSTRVAAAEPAEALVAAASESNAMLIVVGARGDSYVRRALRGSVGEKLVGRAPCDLLIAR